VADHRAVPDGDADGAAVLGDAGEKLVEGGFGAGAVQCPVVDEVLFEQIERLDLFDQCRAVGRGGGADQERYGPSSGSCR